MALRKIEQYQGMVTHYNPEVSEYRVRDSRNLGADYFTDDKEDALASMYWLGKRPPKVGDVLPNGGNVLAYNGGIVLASLPDNKVTPYATWAMEENNWKNTYWGHYYNDVVEAAKGFEARQ